MTGQEAQAYIWSLGWERHVPGLTRIRALMELLGNPQKRLRFIHVAGTNGKGSVCAYRWTACPSRMRPWAG